MYEIMTATTEEKIHVPLAVPPLKWPETFVQVSPRPLHTAHSSKFKPEPM